MWVFFSKWVIFEIGNWTITQKSEINIPDAISSILNMYFGSIFFKMFVKPIPKVVPNQMIKTIWSPQILFVQSFRITNELKKYMCSFGCLDIIVLKKKKKKTAEREEN